MFRCVRIIASVLPICFCLRSSTSNHIHNAESDKDEYINKNEEYGFENENESSFEAASASKLKTLLSLSKSMFSTMDENNFDDHALKVFFTSLR